MIVIERILLLIRNLLHISADSQEEKVGVATKSHDLHVTILPCSGLRMMLVCMIR